MTTKLCVSHHAACDCREETFRMLKLKAEDLEHIEKAARYLMFKNESRIARDLLKDALATYAAGQGSTDGQV